MTDEKATGAEAPQAQRVVLIVDDDGQVRGMLEHALGSYRTLVAEDGAAALELLAREPVDVLLIDYRMPGVDGIEVLQKCRETRPDTLRLLMTEFVDLPQVLARSDGVVQRVVPKPSRPDHVRDLVHEMLNPGSAHVHLDVSDHIVTAVPASSPTKAAEKEPGGALDADAIQLLRWTAGRMTRMKNLIIRQPPRDTKVLQLQFVFPVGEEFEAFRREVVQRWLWPLKPKEAPLPRSAASHPVARLFGDLEVDQEVYAKTVSGPDGERHIYLALFPWRRTVTRRSGAPEQQRVTAALGIVVPEKAEPAGLVDIILDVHRFALEQAKEFHLPELPPKPGEKGWVQMAPEYDWVITASYVGPDRRRKPTTFFNRYVVIGRRQRVAGGGREGFVDRLSPTAAICALLYIVLSAIDTWCTYRYVRNGTVRELNPVLRPLLVAHPWGFLAAKNAFALGAFLVIVRFQLFRIGNYLLAGTVLAYLTLDLYWLVLVGLR